MASTTIAPTTTPSPPVRGVVISHKFPDRVTTVDLIPHVVFSINPGLGTTYDFIDMFISATYKPTQVICSLNRDLSDPATILSDKIITYDGGWHHIKRLPRTANGQVLIGKVLFVKIIFDSTALFYDLKLVKTGYKEITG